MTEFHPASPAKLGRAVREGLLKRVAVVVPHWHMVRDVWENLGSLHGTVADHQRALIVWPNGGMVQFFPADRAIDHLRGVHWDSIIIDDPRRLVSAQVIDVLMSLYGDVTLWV